MTVLERGGVLKNIFTVLCRQLFSIVLQLFIVVIIARNYGPQGNGIYSVSMLLPSMLVTFLNLGVSSSNVYFLSLGETSSISVWRSTLKIFSLVSLVGLFVGFVVVFFFSDTVFPSIPRGLLFLTLLCFPLTLFMSYLSSFFHGLQNFRVLNVLLLLQPSVYLICIIILIIFKVDSLYYLIVSYLLSVVVAVSLGLFYLLPVLSEKEGGSPISTKPRSIGYGLKTYVGNVLTFINYKADVFLVSLFLGPASVGVYIVSVQLSERLWVVSQAVSTVVLPKLTELSDENDKKDAVASFMARWVLWVTIVLAVMLGLVAKPVVLFLFGSEYLAAVEVLWVLLPGVAVVASSRILATDLASRGLPEINAYVSFAVAIINVVGNILLIPKFFLLGAAMATTISYVANYALRLYFHGRYTGVSLRSKLIISRGDFSILCKARYIEPV